MPPAENDLISGPRGRRFYREFALSHQGQDTPEGATLWELLFYAAHRLEIARGQAGTLLGSGVDTPLPDPSIADIAAALDNAPLDAVDDTYSFTALAGSVDSAR
jgi:hypothetical protein